MHNSVTIPYIVQFNENFKVGYRNRELIYYLKNGNRDDIILSLNNRTAEPKGSLLSYPLLPFEANSHKEYSLEAGNTPLLNLKQIGEYYQANVFLKCEHNNPSGSFKDRETVAALLASWQDNNDLTFVYSSGNAACSAAYYCKQNKKQIIAIVPGDIYPEKLDYILECGAKVIVLGDENTVYENGYKLYNQAIDIIYPENNSLVDLSVTNPFRSEGGKTIAFEIIDQLGGVPDFVIAPTANGGLISGAWKGFKELYEIGFIDSLPKMVSIGIRDASPIFDQFNETNSVKKNSNSDTSLVVGSTLAALESYDLHYAIRAINESNGIVLSCDGSDIIDSYKTFEKLEGTLINNHRLFLEPSSMTSFAALHQLKKNGTLSSGDKVVLLGTGDGNKSKVVLNGLIENLPITKTIIDQDSHQTTRNTQLDNMIQVENDLDALVNGILTLL